MSQQVQQRDYRYELIRVIAVFCVIGVHLLYLYPEDGTTLRSLNIQLLDILFPCCNALFFLMSGRFALRKPVADEALGSFYFKKFVYLLFPLFVYLVIYAVGKLWVDQQSLEGLGRHILASICELNNKTHLWYMYVLVGHILVSPFTSRVIANLSRRAAVVFVAVGLLYNLCYVYSPTVSGQSFAWLYPFGGWSFYFYIGGCFDKIINDKKSERYLLMAGVAAFVFMLVKCYVFQFKEHLTDLMPSFTLFVLSVYLLLQKVTIRSEKVQQVINFLGKRSYSMYLMLYVVVYLLTSLLPETHTMPDLLYLFIVMVVCFIAGFISSYLFDLFFIQLLQDLMMKVKYAIRGR